MIKDKSRCNPRAYCCRCGQPIYDSVIPPNVLATFKGGSRDYVDVTCADCTLARVAGIQKKEQTDGTFVPSWAKVLSLGERLGAVRKKLRWSQGRLAEHFGLKSKQAISLYEKDRRNIPEDVKAWIEQMEVMLHKKSRKEVSDLLKSGKSPQEKSTEKAELRMQA